MLAQNTCGDGLPCGQIPWSPIMWPIIATPTFVPTQNAVVTAQPTQAAGLVTTPVPPATQIGDNGFDSFNAEGIAEQMSTLQSVMASSPQQVINDANGQPLDLTQSSDIAAGGVPYSAISKDSLCSISAS